MNLESRLEKLEHEFKILKGEIQTTLLEIQEQILIHYYPTLRADDGVPPTYLQDAVNTLRLGRQDEVHKHGYDGPSGASRGYAAERMPASADGPNHLNGASSAFTDVTFAWMDDDEDEDLVESEIDPPVLPQTREVSLADLKRSQHGLADPPASPAERSPEARQPVEAISNPQALDFAALAEWVGASIRKVGKARAQQAVETYAVGVSLPTEVKEMLLQLIALSDDLDPAEPSNAAGMMDVLVKLDQVWRSG